EGCLSFAPDDRPAEAALVAKALRRHFAPSARLRRWARSRPKSLAGVACLVLLSASAVAWSAATRPPLWVRAYHQGRDAYPAHHYEPADRCFDQPLTANNADFASAFARGQAKLALGDIEGAYNYFDLADRNSSDPADPLRKDGKTQALLAYCQALRD